MTGNGNKVSLLVGTTKGAFFFHSDAERRNWEMTGPHLDGWEIYSLYGANGGSNRIFAGTSHFIYGPTIRVSDDMGETWTQIEEGPRYSQESGRSSGPNLADSARAPVRSRARCSGVDKAGLFTSSDDGTTWEEVTGLTQHETRHEWAPGNGGLCLHTIIVDPNNAQRMWVAMSAVGVFGSEDGGKSWKVCNVGLPQVATGVRNNDVGRCVHKIVLDPKDSNTLYCQFHGGVLKTTNAGDTWEPIETGLPSIFGFPMGITTGGDLFVIPLDSDRYRHVTEGKLRVYRSKDGGASWASSSNGLPEEPQYVGVLRDAMPLTRSTRQVSTSAQAWARSFTPATAAKAGTSCRGISRVLL